VGPRARLDVCEKSRPHRDSIPVQSNPQSVAIPTELSGPFSSTTTFVKFSNLVTTFVFFFFCLALKKKIIACNGVIALVTSCLAERLFLGRVRCPI
jgi:hypothetical protein